MSSVLASVGIGLATGVVAGLATGLYSGLVVSRMIRFHGLCAEVLRAINSVDYMEEKGRARILRSDLKGVMPVCSQL